MDDIDNISNTGSGSSSVDKEAVLSAPYKIQKSDEQLPILLYEEQNASILNISSSKLLENEAPSSSAPGQNKPSPNSSEDVDRDFDYGDDTGEYEDDEETLEEEEAVDDGDAAEELNDLAKEGDMPLDDLMALYYNNQDSNTDYQSNEDIQKSSASVEKNEDNESDDNEDLTRQLRSSTSLLSPTHHQSGDEEDDRDYVPPAPDDWKKSPRVGADYQADSIPETCRQNPDYDVTDDQLVWDPTVMPEQEVTNYLKFVGEASYEDQASLPSGSHLRDNEDALYLLSQSNGDTKEAAKKYRLRPNHLANELPVWTEEECRLFELGLTMYGKDFHAIHQNRVKTKSIGEIVKFYYIWKKSARYDHFNAKTRLGKKKDTMHPGVTDYMERLLDETEHSIASHHGNHSHSGSSSYPPTLSHTAALQQHLAEVRMTRRQNRQQLQPAFDSESPTGEYSEMNGLIDGEYPDEIEMLDGIVPTIPANHIYPPVPFAPIDSGLNVGYPEHSHFAPIALTNHHPDLVQVAPLPANQNNNSHVIASAGDAPSLPFQVAQPNEAKRNVGHGQSSNLLHAAPLPPDVLTSIDELENAYCGSTGSNASSSYSLTQSFPSDHSTSVDSPSEREQQTLNLKRYHCPLGDEDSKRRRLEDFEVAPSASNSSSIHEDASSSLKSSNIPVTHSSLPPSERKDDDVSIEARSIVSC